MSLKPQCLKLLIYNYYYVVFVVCCINLVILLIFVFVKMIENDPVKKRRAFVLGIEKEKPLILIRTAFCCHECSPGEYI